MGEPICLSPEDAVRCFSSTGLDVLAIGPFLLSKTDSK
jgi:carbamoyltransferase